MANEPKKQPEKRTSPDDAEPPKKTEKADKKPVGSGGGKMVFWGVLAGVIVINTIVAVLVVQLIMPRPEKPKAEAAGEADSTVAQGEVLEEPAFSDPPIEAVVNIKGSDGMHFLKAVLIFSYDAKKFKELGQALTDRTPEFKNIIVDRLSARSMEDLERPNAREEIRAELKRLINKQLILGGGGKSSKEPWRIADVYINEFIIQ
jgi:flagellar basal body-associated protein FliL